MIDPKTIDDHLARTLKMVEQYDCKLRCASAIKDVSRIHYLCLIGEAGTDLREAIATAALELIDKTQKNQENSAIEKD